jgi:2-polyprenyl-3-methyl-5-hydroxy-6-metoxy-1,4-benzoquinol methylase
VDARDALRACPRCTSRSGVRKDMYRQFARFYDAIPLNDFTPIVMELIRARQQAVHDVLDLGCGTGKFLLRLAEQGIGGTGIDISEDMIARARTKAEESAASGIVSFRVGSIVDFRLDKTFDLVTCNLDTINHLLSEDEVRRTFANTYQHLNDNGMFYFDIHTTAGLRSWVYQQNIHDENLVRFWHGTFNEGTAIGTLYIDAFVKVDPRISLYQRYYETVHERAYPLTQILEWLRDAGFTDVKPVGPVAGLSVEQMETDLRSFFCAVK